MAASDHLHPGQIQPEHREAALEALRRASETMGEHPESFKMTYYNPESGGLTLERQEEELKGSSTPQISQHEFDISESPVRYTNLWVGSPEGRHGGRSSQSWNPEAREQFHGLRDYRREGVWYIEQSGESRRRGHA